MPKLPIVSGRDVVRALKELGFSHVSTRGSHMKMQHPDGRIATVPNHKTIKKGTLKKGILNPLSISVKQFIDLL